MRLAAVLALLLAAAPAGAAPEPARAASCRAAQLRLRVGTGVSEATGQHTLVLRIVDRGRACALTGYPAVELADAKGPVPFRVRHGGDQMLAPRPPRPVRVSSGGSAFVVVNHYRCDLGDRRAATRVRLVLPARAGRLDLVLPPRLRVSWCGRGDPGSTLTVSPFVPTVAVALRG